MTVDLATFSPDTPFRGSNAASAAAGGSDDIGLGKYFERQQSFAHSSAANLGAEYLRETMASNQRHHGASTRFASAPTTFADHFRKRQERKRSGGESAHHSQRRGQSEPPRARFEENPDEDGAEYDNEPSSNNQSGTHQYARRGRSGGHTGMPCQMYNSPTYDIAQMTEQVRLSLKLEVDARAAIAERQLSALLQLCKISTDEMDRLRVEVCANDRQLHTLEQVQSKLRQELTTQKGIGFYLQSMCGKDESWRMQAENQLLELRQMVAAIREQGNSLHAMSQEKLSRAKLLVQFNACTEPIKARFQADLQYQAHLPLDALTQKVSRGLTDEVSELRNELHALKNRVTKMTTVFDNRNVQQQQEPVVPAPVPAVPVKDPAEEQERARQKAKRKAELVSELQSQVLGAVGEHVRDKMNELENSVNLRLEKWQVLYDQCVAVQARSQTACQDHLPNLTASIESQLKALQQQLHNEVAAITRDVNDRVQQVKHEITTAAAALVGAKAAACQTRQIDLLKVIECEQTERERAVESVQESCRKSRHSLEGQVHALAQENHTKSSQAVEMVESKVKEIEKHAASASCAAKSEMQRRLDASSSTLKAQCDALKAVLERKVSVCEDSIAKLGETIATLSASVEIAKESAKEAMSRVTETNSDDRKNIAAASSASSNAEGNTCAYLAVMDAMLQKMNLQLQLQSQAQQQAQAAQFAPMYSAPYLAPSPHHQWSITTSYPAAPTLSQPSVSCTNGSGQQQAASVPDTANPAPVDLSGEPKVSVETADKALEFAASSKPGTAETQPAKPASAAAAAGHEGAKVAAPACTPVAGISADAATVRESAKTGPSVATDALRSPEAAAPDAVAEDPAVKIQETIAATTKGALAEAEMAKLRVETRRKQEMGMRQQQQGIRSGASTANAAAVPPSSTAAPAPPHAPYLTRTASSSALLPSPSSESVDANDASSSNTPLPRPRSNSIMGRRDPNAAATAAKATCSCSTSALFRYRETPSSTESASPTACIHSVRPEVKATPSANGSLSGAAPAAVAAPRAQPTPHRRSQAPAPPPQVPGRPAAPSVHSETTGGKPPATPLSSAPLPPSPAASTASLASSASHVLCSRCRLPVRSNLRVEHERSQCPKRTEECATRGSNVLWSDSETHQTQCAAKGSSSSLGTGSGTVSSTTTTTPTPSASIMKTCRHCNADVSGPDLFEHELRCDKMLKQCPHCLRRQKLADLQEHIENCDCRLAPCPNDCGGKFLQRGIPKHLATRCSNKSSSASSVLNPAAPTGASAVATMSAPSAPTVPIEPSSAQKPGAPPLTVPSAAAPPQFASAASSSALSKAECKFCDEEFPTSAIEAHEDACDWKPKRCQHCNMVVILRDLARHEALCKTSQKNCVHCNESVPHAALGSHTTRCSKRPIKCIRCCQQSPADSVVAHSTNCKFVPSSTPVAVSSNATASPRPAAARPATPPAGVSAPSPTLGNKISPPRPYPPTGSVTHPGSVAPQPSAAARPASATPSTPQPKANDADDALADRMARRNLALSQLTNPSATPSAPSLAGSTPAPRSHGNASRTSGAPEQGGNDDEEEEDEDDEREGQLTLAQVVAEWNVENVCLWLHEDAGVPEVVPRFQQRQCDGEVLLDLTESDLINDFGVKNWIHRERILNAIEAIKTSDEFSDGEEEEGEDDDGEEEDEEEGEVDDADDAVALAASQRHARSPMGEVPFLYPRDLLRRGSLPSPEQGGSATSLLPSSAMATPTGNFVIALFAMLRVETILTSPTLILTSSQPKDEQVERSPQISKQQ